MHQVRRPIQIVAVLGLMLLLEGLTVAGDVRVDFLRDVKPILDESCVQCHAGDKRKGGFSINTRDSLISGSEDGPVVEPGNGAASKLIHLVVSTDAQGMMPPKGDRLTAAQVEMLRVWID